MIIPFFERGNVNNIYIIYIYIIIKWQSVPVGSTSVPGCKLAYVDP